MTAHAWQNIIFVGFAMFLAILVSLFFTAQAFHPDASEADGGWESDVPGCPVSPVPGLLPVGIRDARQGGKESAAGYTTLRYADPATIEIRDSHGDPIPADDRRLKLSSTLVRALLIIAPVCAVAGGVFFLIRVMLTS